MTPAQSSNLVRWAAETFHTAMFINYEQVKEEVISQRQRRKSAACSCHVSEFYIHIKSFLSVIDKNKKKIEIDIIVGYLSLCRVSTPSPNQGLTLNWNLGLFWPQNVLLIPGYWFVCVSHWWSSSPIIWSIQEKWAPAFCVRLWFSLQIPGKCCHQPWFRNVSCWDSLAAVTQHVHPGEHERSIWPGDDREPAASPVLLGRCGGLLFSGHSGNPVLSLCINKHPDVRESSHRRSAACVQKERFLKAGWEHADALDMMMVYSMLPQDDVAR